MREQLGRGTFIMKVLCGLILLVFSLFTGTWAQASGQPIFGPVKYDVRQRYGRENRYQETIRAAEGNYTIVLENGEHRSQRADLLKFSLNGRTLLQERHYAYPYLFCYVSLKNENAFSLEIRDFVPEAFRRPAVTPKHVVMTVMPSASKLENAILGAFSPEDLQVYTEDLLKIKKRQSFALARIAADLQNEEDVRFNALKELARLKDPDAGAFLLHLFRDLEERTAVRGDAALGLGMLGDSASIPHLIQGVIDPEETIRVMSARALSFYKEEYTAGLLFTTLASMDSLMSAAVIRSIVRAGWRPEGALLDLAGSPDPEDANIGIELLIGSRDRRTVDLMLTYLENPGQRDILLIIAVLRESGDGRGIQPLAKAARDPARGKGIELELGLALAALGDPGSADLIGELINKVDVRKPGYDKLLEEYQKLMRME